MKKSNFSESQKQSILLEGESGKMSIEKLCEHYQVSPATYYKWSLQKLIH